YARAPKDYPNPFTMKLGGVDFDNALSSARRNVVNALYDQVITFRHAELKAAWKAILAAEAAVAKAKETGKDVAKAAGLVAEARDLASRVPIDGKKAADKAINNAFKEKAELKSKLETEWDTFAKGNYAKARGLAEQAAATL
ncbi:MAG: ABC transporter substrate-binding protein, partial [Candidatus Methylomirabilales bacterium]